MLLDDWQNEFIAIEGDKLLYCGRQIGKSVVCAADAGEWSANNPNTTTLMIAPTERQAHALFAKTKNYMFKNYRSMIKGGKDKPTLQRFCLTNGSEVWCLPTGLTGDGVRFLTVHRLYCEEMSRIPAAVFDAVNPMMLTTGGATIGLTTPAGSGTYASNIWHNKDGVFDTFTRMSISSEDVANKRPISDSWTIKQKEDAIARLKREKARMTRLQYAQEYLGKEIDSLLRYFPKKLIEACMTLEPGYEYAAEGNDFLGVDVAGMGGDDNVLISLRQSQNGSLYMNTLEIFEKVYTTTCSNKIIELHKARMFKKIFVDDGGVGFGVFSELMSSDLTKGRTEAINNSSRSLDKYGEQKKRILKDDLYMNCKNLMEKGKLKFYKDPRVFQSLSSVFCEVKDGKQKIYGEYTHIAEALIRACWGATSKNLNIRIDWV